MRAKSSESGNRLSAANIAFHLFRCTVLPLLSCPEPDEQRPPAVIGALGGSGVRVIPAIMRTAGFWMGAWVNPKTEDAMATRFFLQRYFDGAVASPAHCEADLRRACASAVAAHRWRMPDTKMPWGWKNPRCMWVIPFLTRVYPGLKFIHVVRDGRDMALTNNTNLLRQHGELLLDDPAAKSDQVRAQLELWTKGNRTAHGDGSTHLGHNYLCITYEDLGDCRKQTYRMAQDSHPPSRSGSACIVVLCARCRGKEGRREDKTGGMFLSGNRLRCRCSGWKMRPALASI